MKDCDVLCSDMKVGPSWEIEYFWPKFGISCEFLFSPILVLYFTVLYITLPNMLFEYCTVPWLSCWCFSLYLYLLFQSQKTFLFFPIPIASPIILANFANSTSFSPEQMGINNCRDQKRGARETEENVVPRLDLVNFLKRRTWEILTKHCYRHIDIE